ncbi:16S rRNA (adenine(1518)-N(6)/adenine(1519)-N(6))-dimethyltransferase RsmA [Adlercreutzia agrestimuris]|uniref:16S rRNA (adenine(1518)-N(6)/adenine(1519)-N(6))- dimethyltransferase RsmA n=1 Tax=Adlercreutzia agrestimuris TaxID=2941324 RepID=UPI002040A5ED|nr:16S rRNA (adenine(1518)-N(6)/adenine(1519)-N(6))-dimethyltransferase RsmA [Adlercreutzia agrestimuris]
MPSLSPLASVKATRAVLELHGLSTKYSLGQNFLVNDAIVQKIVSLAELDSSDGVLEVGPGIGTLTLALLTRAGWVVSIERDEDLVDVLAQTTAPWADHFALISADALQVSADEIATCAAQLTAASAATSPALATVDTTPFPNKLVANLPYAVAATIVLDYFERFEEINSATVMVQKEVADRMSATPGSKNYGAYTVKLRLYTQVAGRFQVSPQNFFPPPRVESSVIKLDRRTLTDAQGEPLSKATLRCAAQMADAAFATRRKTIANSCKTYFSGRGAQGAHVLRVLPEILQAAHIDPKRRGETLDLDEFIALGCALQTLGEQA